MTTSTLHRLRAAIGDPSRLAPVSIGAGVELAEVEPGRVRARLPAASVLPAFGAVLVLADFVLGAAIGTGLPAGHRVSTLSLHPSLLTAASSDGLVATGGLEHLSDDTGVSRAEVHDTAGGLVAVLSCRCAVLPSTGAPPPPGPVVPLVLRLEAADGLVRAVADPALANFGGTVQGGVVAAVLAQSLDAGRPGVELEVSFLRAVPADGATLTARAVPVHTGSRFAVGRAELVDARDRLAAVATASRWLSS